MGDPLQAHFLKALFQIQNSKYKIHIHNYPDGRCPTGSLHQNTNKLTKNQSVPNNKYRVLLLVLFSALEPDEDIPLQSADSLPENTIIPISSFLS